MKMRVMAVGVAAFVMIAWPILAASGCSSGPNGTSEKIAPTWTTIQVEGDLVSIPRSQIEESKMVHFRVGQQSVGGAFMAYLLGEEIHVRASVCPPCRSESFSLVGSTLVCDTCGTRFEGTTGAGISGACKNYPKAEATYSGGGDNIALSLQDLANAYENTKSPGWA